MIDLFSVYNVIRTLQTDKAALADLEMLAEGVNEELEDEIADLLNDIKKLKRAHQGQQKTH